MVKKIQVKEMVDGVVMIALLRLRLRKRLPLELIQQQP